MVHTCVKYWSVYSCYTESVKKNTRVKASAKLAFYTLSQKPPSTHLNIWLSLSIKTQYCCTRFYIFCTRVCKTCSCNTSRLEWTYFLHTPSRVTLYSWVDQVPGSGSPGPGPRARVPCRPGSPLRSGSRVPIGLGPNWPGPAVCLIGSVLL